MEQGIGSKGTPIGKGALVVPNHELIDSKRGRYEAVAKQLTPAKENRAACCRGIRGLMAVTIILTLCFSRPLYDLAWYSLHRELDSYIPLDPIDQPVPDLVEEAKSDFGVQAYPAI